jgi:hypothetical protein
MLRIEHATDLEREAFLRARATGEDREQNKCNEWAG